MIISSKISNFPPALFVLPKSNSEIEICLSTSEIAASAVRKTATRPMFWEKIILPITIPAKAIKKPAMNMYNDSFLKPSFQKIFLKIIVFLFKMIVLSALILFLRSLNV